MQKKSREKSVTVLVFGVFDHFHPGHDFFLKQASKHGRVIAVVARADSVKQIKKRSPDHSEKTRLANIRKSPHVWKALLGDKILGSYKVLKKLKPHIIDIGYDQKGLEKDLRRRMQRGLLPKIRIIRLKAHKPHKFKTSIIARAHAKRK